MIRTFLLSIVIFICSCQNKKSGSGGLGAPFSDEIMIDVLVDMHYAGESTRITRGNNHDSLYKVYTKQLLEINNMSQEDLDNMMNYLEEHIEHYYDLEKKVHAKVKELNED